MSNTQVAGLVVGALGSGWVAGWHDDVEPPPRSSPLTKAERAVAAMLLEGRSNAAIAFARQSSARTVANQIASIYRKLGVGSRAQLAAHEASRFLVAAKRDPDAPELPVFTAREVVGFAALGLANKFIAYELGISETSVSTALRSVAAKLGARTRIELVRLLATGHRP